jgi:transposase
MTWPTTSQSNRRRIAASRCLAVGADRSRVYIYGYLNRVRSSRRLEAECHRNVEVIWLLTSWRQRG